MLDYVVKYSLNLCRKPKRLLLNMWKQLNPNTRQQQARLKNWRYSSSLFHCVYSMYIASSYVSYILHLYSMFCRERQKVIVANCWTFPTQLKKNCGITLYRQLQQGGGRLPLTSVLNHMWSQQCMWTRAVMRTAAWMLSWGGWTGPANSPRLGSLCWKQCGALVLLKLPANWRWRFDQTHCSYCNHTI